MADPRRHVALVVVNQELGGRELYTLLLARELLARGHRVSAMGPIRACAAAFTEAGVEVLPGGVRGLRGVAGPWRLLRALRAAAPDVVYHAELSPKGTVAAALAGVPRRVSTLIVDPRTQLAGASWHRRLRLRLRFLAERLVRPLDHLWASVSESTRDGFRETHGRGSVVLSPTIAVSHAEALDPCETFAMPRGLPVVAYAGRLTAAKGAFDAVAALAGARRRGRDARLLMLGSDPRRGAGLRALEALAAELGVSDRVHLAGFWRGDAVALFRGCAAVMLPSRAEGCPLVLLEAAQAGAPAVGYRVAGVRDVVEPGVTGWLAPAGDREALGAALATALGLDDAGRAAVSAAAQERFRARYHPDGALEAMVQALLPTGPRGE